MEQPYKKRLHATLAGVAYAIIGACVDVLLAQDRLRLALVPQEPTAETGTARGEPNTAPDLYTDPEANPGPGEQMVLEVHVAADANLSPGPNPAPEDSTTEGKTPEDNPSSEEAKVPIPHENLNPEENPAQSVPCPETNPAQQTSPGTNATPQMQLGSETNSALEEDDLASRTNLAPQISSATEANTTSEANLSIEMNVVPETSAASGTNIARDETSQQAKETHEPNLATASHVPAREGQVANLPGQHEGSHDDASPPATSSSNHQMLSARSSSKRPSATPSDQQPPKRPRPHSGGDGAKSAGSDKHLDVIYVGGRPAFADQEPDEDDSDDSISSSTLTMSAGIPWPNLRDQDKNEQTLHTSRSRFDHELRQFIQDPRDPDSYQSGSDKLLELAGNIRKLKIELAQSAKERLHAVLKTFVHAIIVVPQESTDTAGGKPNTAPDPYTDPGANPGGKHMMLEALVVADANPSPGPNPAPEQYIVILDELLECLSFASEYRGLYLQ
ncbi:collagen triple helix [Ilyonectria robusta]